MAYDYGFDELGNELIDIFAVTSPDFDKAEKLLNSGLNINALNKDRDENLLSEAIWNHTLSYRLQYLDDFPDGEIDDSLLGPTVYEIIQLFLSHGFDVNECDGRLGAQCLKRLVLASFDRYLIISTKILLDAGARNLPTSDDPDDDTPWDAVGAEGCFQDTCEGNYHVGNLFEAVYQIYQALEDGKPYEHIDSYECAIGKKILKVLASPNDKPSIFYPMDLPSFKNDNCFTSDLYFVYADGALRTTQYADFWVDTIPDDGELIDVSEFFEGIVGGVIKDFHLSGRSVKKDIQSYDQPISRIEMEDGHYIKFSINFGDVEDENRAAFFEIY